MDVFLQQVLNGLTLGGIYGLVFWMPQLIKTAGTQDTFAIGLISAIPYLVAGVTMIGGEGRFRQLYVPGGAATVAARWADRLGPDAWVLTRDEAIDAGWFGPLPPRLADRFGDVLVAMADDGALMTTTQPNEFGLVGMHGSVTPAELNVPLLVG